MRFAFFFLFFSWVGSSSAQDKNRTFQLYQELLQSLDCTCSKPFIQDRKKLISIPSSSIKKDTALFLYTTPKGEKIVLKIIMEKSNLNANDSFIKTIELSRDKAIIEFKATQDFKNIDLNTTELYLSKNKKHLFLYLKSTKDNYALKLIFDQKKFITKFKTSNKTVNQFDFLDGIAE